jgi:hypothetical protein
VPFGAGFSLGQKHLSVTAALVKRVSQLEEESVLLERGSEMVGETVRSLCDQLAFLDNEVRRLSDVCDKLVNQKKADTVDNLTSAASERPLSANQGRILNGKLETIAGYF